MRRTVLSIAEKPDWAALTETERRHLAGDGLLTGIGLSRSQDGLAWFIEGQDWLTSEKEGEARQEIGRHWRLNWTPPAPEWVVGEAMPLAFAFGADEPTAVLGGEFHVQVRLVAICAPQAEVIRVLDELELGKVAALQRFEAMRTGCLPAEVVPVRVGVDAEDLEWEVDRRLVRETAVPLPESWLARVRPKGRDMSRRLVLEVRFMASEAGDQLGDDLLGRARLYFVFVPKV